MVALLWFCANSVHVRRVSLLRVERRALCNKLPRSLSRGVYIFGHKAYTAIHRRPDFFVNLYNLHQELILYISELFGLWFVSGKLCMCSPRRFPLFCSESVGAPCTRWKPKRTNARSTMGIPQTHTRPRTHTD